VTVGLKVVDETNPEKTDVKRAAVAAWTLTIMVGGFGRVGRGEVQRSFVDGVR